MLTSKGYFQKSLYEFFFNLDPKELEQMLLAHPKIASVIILTHEDMMEMQKQGIFKARTQHDSDTNADI